MPAGVAPEDLERRSGAGRRGKVRRRARFLRRARELALRDLGGLVYEAARRDQDGGSLVKEKVQHLGVIDAELLALEGELSAPRGETVLREPGVGGTCPRCGELHASDAHFCSRCGLELTAVPVPVPEQAAVAASAPNDAPATEGDAAAAPAASESTPAEMEAGEGTLAEHPRRGSKRWWRRRAPAAGEAAAAEPATGEAPAAAPVTHAAAASKPAEPATAETPAAEPPTTDLSTGSPQTGNGRAAKQDAADREPSA